jgi:hypothetical protein
MEGSIGQTLKGFVLWNHGRATWQYDVMVVGILAFIFLTPREFFRDGPRPKSVVLLPSEGGSSRFLIEPDRITAAGEAARRGQAEKLITSQAGNEERVLVKLEALYGADQEVRGYIASTRP